MVKKVSFKSIFFLTASTLLAGTSLVGATETAHKKDLNPELNQEATPSQDTSKISEAFGHLIGKNLESLGFDLNVNLVIKGIQDSISGKDSPLTESECVQAISLVQEQAFQKLSQKNLKEAQDFMEENHKSPGIVAIEKGKLHYKIEKEGKGKSVESHFSPLIRYKGLFLDGKVFGVSQEDEIISLQETIPGFSQGIVGMKEGEKRILYIHPDLGYGTTSGHLPPNSHLTFEIEVIKSNSETEKESAISTTQTQDALPAEIASDQEGIR